MNRFTLQKTLPGRCLVFGVYFVLFFVQLHLRYICGALPDGMDKPLVVNTSEKHYQFKNYNTDAGGKARPEFKLSKRYIPAHVLESFTLEIQFHLSEVIVLLQTEVIAPPPSLLSTLLTCSSFRGPPAC